VKLVLDTDVLSALLKPEKNQQIVRWADSVSEHELFITSTTVSELIYGLVRAPEGRRKDQLDDGISRLVSMFGDRVLNFDFAAAFDYGRFVADLQAGGSSIDRADAQIAACCRANGAALATRNTKDFEDIPWLTVINPWEAN
jgi:predicted nucleic acid-binding protein